MGANYFKVLIIWLEIKLSYDETLETLFYLYVNIIILFSLISRTFKRVLRMIYRLLESD